MKEIIIQPSAAQTLRVTVGGVNTNIRIYWNENHNIIQKDLNPIDKTPEGFYFIDIQNLYITIKGMKLVTDRDMLEPYAIAEFGGLVLIDTQGERLDPSFDDLGNRHALMYIELHEKEQIREALNNL